MVVDSANLFDYFLEQNLNSLIGDLLEGTSDCSLEVQVDLTEELLWVELSVLHSLASLHIILDDLLDDRAFELHVLFAIDFSGTAVEDRPLISDTDITQALSLQDQLAAEEVFSFQIFKAVQHDVLQVWYSLPQEELLDDVQAFLCLTPIEDIELSVPTVELHAYCDDVQVFVSANLGLLVVLGDVLGRKLEVELLLTGEDDICLHIVDVCDVLIL